MRKKDFRQWLTDRIGRKTISDYISRCTKVESALKTDLDVEYNKDKGRYVLSKLNYTTEDARANVPIPSGFDFKEGCNVAQRMTDMRTAVRRYLTFCERG